MVFVVYQSVLNRRVEEIETNKHKKFKYVFSVCEDLLECFHVHTIVLHFLSVSLSKLSSLVYEDSDNAIRDLQSISKKALLAQCFLKPRFVLHKLHPHPIDTFGDLMRVNLMPGIAVSNCQRLMHRVRIRMQSTHPCLKCFIKSSIMRTRRPSRPVQCRQRWPAFASSPTNTVLRARASERSVWW